MSEKDRDQLPIKGLLPGFETGRYEPVRRYDPAEFAGSTLDEHVRRDNRVNVRISGHDISVLQRHALDVGVPLQSFIASIVHAWVQTAEQVPPGKPGVSTQPILVDPTLFDKG